MKAIIEQERREERECDAPKAQVSGVTTRGGAKTGAKDQRRPAPAPPDTKLDTRSKPKGPHEEGPGPTRGSVRPSESQAAPPSVTQDRGPHDKGVGEKPLRHVPQGEEDWATTNRGPPMDGRGPADSDLGLSPMETAPLGSSLKDEATPSNTPEMQRAPRGEEECTTEDSGPPLDGEGPDGGGRRSSPIETAASLGSSLEEEATSSTKNNGNGPQWMGEAQVTVVNG